MGKGRARSIEPRGPARRRAGSVTPSPALTERHDRVKQARVVAPLEDHAIIELMSLRADPMELLERQGPSRVAELLPNRLSLPRHRNRIVRGLATPHTPSNQKDTP